jgi:hypothetical protein
VVDAGEADWCMAGDPCPRCGSGQTIVSDVWMLRQHGKIRAAATPVGRNKVFGMYCYGCGHRTRKEGIPGRSRRQSSTLSRSDGPLTQ